MEGTFGVLPLSEVFTTAGALLWGGVIAGLVQLGKKVSFIPITSRTAIWAVALLAVAITGLAVVDAQMALEANTIVLIVLTWAGLSTASIGAYEAASRGVEAVVAPEPTTGAHDT